MLPPLASYLIFWVFPTVKYVDNGGNREVFASPSPEVFDRFGNDLYSYPSDLSSMMARVKAALTFREGGDLILTDDKAPVELLGMRVIDEIISDELEYYRDLFKGKGLSEIIDMLG